MIYVRCWECGAVNDAVEEQCYGCETAFKWNAIIQRKEEQDNGKKKEAGE